MHEELTQKLDTARGVLERTGGCAVAYSGGVDSSLVLAIAHEVLGSRCLAVIATSSTYARREHEQALKVAGMIGARHEVVPSEELDIPGFRDNPTNRCYFCKKELFARVREVASRHGLAAVADGTNADDLTDYRPGLLAVREMGVLSPLREAGLTKSEIRLISREVYGLPTAGKPAMACLASRFPYGSQITGAKLDQVDRLEGFLLEQGFVYVTLDLQGYRTGSMNEPKRLGREDVLAAGKIQG